MAQEANALQWRSRRDWTLAVALCLGLLGLRSWFYLAWEESFFSSDQAIIGLMAKHLAEGRAWPLFYYGQEYLLAVEAWFAAPMFVVLGSSVATLRLMVIVLNAITGFVLLRLLVKDAGLGVWSATLASSPFWIAPVIPAASLVEAGANIDPFLWVLVAWMVRRRPLWLGLCLGVGFLNREFTLYAVPPIIAADIVEGRGVDRALLRSWIVTAAGVLLAIQSAAALKPYADIYGPGTAGLPVAGQSVASQLVGRAAWDPHLFGQQALDMFTSYLPGLVGVAGLPPSLFGIGTPLTVGWPMLRVPLTTLVIVLLAGLGVDYYRSRPSRQALMLPLYLIVVGVIAGVAYALFRPYSLATTRYALLLLYAPIGVAALALHPARAVAIRALAASALLVLAAGSSIDHLRVIAAARVSPPKSPIRAIVQRLEQDGTTIARAEYWHAYTITFLSNERIKVAASDVPRVAEYATLAARAEAANGKLVVIQPEPCAGGALVGDSYICPR